MNVKLTEPSLASDEDFGRQPPADWLNEVRRAIETSPWSASISALARSAGVHRVHLHRQFRKAYGIAPASFRTRSMVGHAIMLTLMEDRPLAEAGLTAGFADQSHLTRAVKAVCGLPIGRLRRLMSVQAA
jgi:AraC family transcriptional regulator